MPKAGAYLVSDLPDDRLTELICPRCGRHGRYSRATIAARLGADTPLPTALRLLAGCERASSMDDPCQARYVNLPWA